MLFSASLKKVFLIELTVPAEEGIEAANLRKQGRYFPLVTEINDSTKWSAKCLAIEVGARGFVALSTQSFLRKFGIPDRALKKLVKTLSTIAAKCSYSIYLAHENKMWDSKRDLLVAD